MGVKENGLERLHPAKSPEVLASNAGEILARLGYPDRPVDRAFGFSEDNDLSNYIARNDKPPDWKQALTQRPMLLNFWYRQSPSEMVAEGVWAGGLTPGVVTFDDPAPTLSGMITVWLDAEGRLQWLQALPPQVDTSASAAQQPAHAADWSALFAAAEIDPSQLHSVAPTWNSLAAADERKAWDGVWPGSGRPLHVEAAAWHGKPVYFNLVGPWTKPERMPNRSVQSGNVKVDDDRKGRIQGISFFTLVIILVLGGIWFAVRNIARGRGDRKGAWRLAWVVFAVEIATFLFRAHFVPVIDALLPVLLAISTALFAAGIMWVLYMALEPYVRRTWPQTIISWTRLVNGRLRDPLVGRDLVFGVLIGMIWVLVYKFGRLFEIRSGAPFPIPVTEFLLGTREALAMCLSIVVISIMGTLMFFFTLVLLSVLVRNRWLAAVLFVLIYSLPKIVASDHVLTETLIWVPIEAIAAIAVVRFGLIALGVACFMANLLLNVPYTLDFSNWYAAHCMFIVLLFVALGTWGFYLSLAGKPLWKDELLE
jgi:hypothetical protein